MMELMHLPILKDRSLENASSINSNLALDGISIWIAPLSLLRVVSAAVFGDRFDYRGLCGEDANEAQGAGTCYSVLRRSDVLCYPEVVRRLIVLSGDYSRPGNRLHLLAPPGFYDLIIDRDRFTHDAYHEYWLWQDGGVTSKSNIDTAVAWQCATGVQLVTPPEPTAEISDQMRQWLDATTSSAERLAEHQQACGHMPSGKSPKVIVEDMARILCRYLPPYRRNDRDYPPPEGADLAGPRPWRGLNPPVASSAVSQYGISPLHRAMMLDGWIVPWQAAGPADPAISVHPASLALLYWAAWYLGRPYCDSPLGFVQGYDFSGWFGGRLAGGPVGGR